MLTRYDLPYYLWRLPLQRLRLLACKALGHRWIERCERYVTRDNDYNEDWFDECVRCGARCKDSSTLSR